MKSRIVKTWILAAVVASPFIGMLGCAEEVSHTETNKPGWFGGHKHEETTVYRNPDGSTSVEHEKQTVRP